VQLLLRAKQVFVRLASGQWQQFVASSGAMYNSGLPAAATAPGTVAPPPAVVVDPPRSVVAPGSSGRTVTVAAGTAIATITAGIQAALAGDTLLIEPGTYKETPPAIMVPLHIVGTGATLDCTGLTGTLAHGKGGIVPAAECIIEGLTITGVAMDQGSAQMTSGVRPDDGCGWLTLKDMHIHGCQVGVGQGGFDCVIEIDDCDVSDNGLGDGYTHNVYVHGTRLELRNVRSVSPRGGHSIKSRSLQFILSGGTFDAMDASIIDLPDGVATPFSIGGGAVFTKPAGAANHNVFSIGEESQTNGSAGGVVTGVTIDALCDAPFIQSNAGAIVFDGTVKFSGNKVTATGSGAVTGLPV
jgi:hypothetical protein